LVDTIIRGDSLEVMRKMKDKSIDLAFTDPPYGKKADKGTNGFGQAKNRKYKDDWDSFTPGLEYFTEILRVSKKAIIFGGNYFTPFLPVSNCWLVWDKKGDVPFNNPFADCELIWTNFNKPIKKYTFKQQGFIKDTKDIRVHPTQKPTELIEMILRDFSNEGDIILDPFLGSGTTAVACVRLDRHCVGVELSEEHYNTSCERVEQERAVKESQPELM